MTDKKMQQIIPTKSTTLGLNTQKPTESGALLPVVGLALRFLALACLAATILDLRRCTATISATTEDGEVFEAKVIKFSDFYAYRYMFVCAATGIIFTVLLIDLSVSHLSNRIIRRDAKFQLYNEIMLMTLVSGGAASIGLTVEMGRLPVDVLQKIASADFVNNVSVITSFYLLGFISNYVSSVILRPGHS